MGLPLVGPKGVRKDYVEAYKWYNLAASQGNESAKKNMGTIAGSMTPEQITEARKRSANFKPRIDYAP